MEQHISAPMNQDDNIQYTIATKLGEGSQASVYRVDVEGKEYALKVAQDPYYICTLEVDILTRLRHPCLMHRELDLVTRIRDTSNGLGYLLPLGSRTLSPTQNYSTETILKVIYDVLCGLQFLHEQGILHLDVKPENILLFDDGNEERAVLTDFGISALMVDGKVVTNYEKYTPMYRPAIDYRRDNYTPASDVYALGASILDIYTMKMDVTCGQTCIDRLLTKVPEVVRSVISRMVRVNPKERATISELLQLPVFNSYPKYQGTTVLPPEDPRVPIGDEERAALLMEMGRRMELSFLSSGEERPSVELQEVEDYLLVRIRYLAYDIYSRLEESGVFSECKDKILANTIHIASEYYGIYTSNPPEDLASAFAALKGYICRW